MNKVADIVEEIDEDKLFAEAAAAADAKRGITHTPAVTGADDDDDDAASEETGKTDGTAASATATAETTDKTETTESKDAAASDAPESDETQPSADGKTPAGQPKADIWASATPEQRAAFTQATDLANRFKAEQGRVPGLQRDLHRLTQENSELRQRASSTPQRTAADDRKSEESLKEKLKSLAEDYPDFQPLLEKFDQLEQRVSETKGGVDTIAQERFSRQLDENEKKLTEAVPKWGDYAKDQAFGDWLATKSRSFRTLAEKNAEAIVDADAAIDVMSAYEQHLELQTARAAAAAAKNGGAPPNKLAAKRDAQLAAARGPAGNRSPSVSGNRVANSDDALWDEASRAADNKRKAAYR